MFRNKKDITLNFLLATISSAFGLLIFNFAFLFYISNYDQSKGMPRKLLFYIPRPTQNWNYPDLNIKSSKKFILVGDSYWAGAGDTYLDFCGPTFGPVPIIGTFIRWLYSKFVS